MATKIKIIASYMYTLEWSGKNIFSLWVKHEGETPIKYPSELTYNEEQVKKYFEQTKNENPTLDIELEWRWVY